jgi:chromosome segregation ATPase
MYKMGKNSRKNNGSKPNQNQPVISQQQKQVTREDLSASKSMVDFEKTKVQLISQFQKELSDYDKKKDTLKKEIETLENNIENKKNDLIIANNELKPVEEKVKEAKKHLGDLEVSKKEEEKIVLTMKADAEAQILKKMDDADRKIKGEYHEFIQELNEFRENLNLQQKEVLDKDIKLTRNKNEIEYQIEMMGEEREHIERLKERYASTSPEKIEELNIDLSDKSKLYETLLAKYEEQGKKYLHVQSVLDTIEADSGMSVNSLLKEIDVLKSRKEELELIYEKYPDMESIEELENTKEKYEKLAAKAEAIERERQSYKNELIAYQSAQKELEITQRIVAATKTLNEHLLRELESHKTALESRTGDTCPALTKVDAEVNEPKFLDDIKRRNNRERLSSLKDIVTHVKNYAGSRKNEEQLYYRDDDIRTFLAGMAVSRLLILQGMSGTGKSSLPRIFSEAISGFNHLIPVESSWRDRNELLGYYNDFNKKFNAKSFTIELYRSGKEVCQNTPAFIVLDEMNLARIEYYFSDFLSVLQEPDPEKWLIELHPNDMRTFPMDLSLYEKDSMQKTHQNVFDIWKRIEKSYSGDLRAKATDEEKAVLADYLREHDLLTGAKDLVNGKMVKIFENTWFIGTANKDESTFEITDKVYDRAQVLSLDKKGVSEKNYPSVNEKRIYADELLELFNKAVNDFSQRNIVDDKLNELDNLLMDKFDISFGNRIIRQTEKFAAVFVAAGGRLDDALDYQISAKILRKVLTSDDKDAFMHLEIFAEKYTKTKSMVEKRLRYLGK